MKWTRHLIFGRLSLWERASGNSRDKRLLGDNQPELTWYCSDSMEKLRRSVLILRVGQQEMHTDLWFVNPTIFRRRWETNIEFPFLLLHRAYCYDYFFYSNSCTLLHSLTLNLLAPTTVGARINP